jgi:hypothetical protein
MLDAAGGRRAWRQLTWNGRRLPYRRGGARLLWRWDIAVFVLDNLRPAGRNPRFVELLPKGIEQASADEFL